MNKITSGDIDKSLNNIIRELGGFSISRQLKNDVNTIKQKLQTQASEIEILKEKNKVLLKMIDSKTLLNELKKMDL